MEEFHQRLHVGNVGSLKTLVFPYEAFDVAKSWRTIEMELWFVLREQILLQRLKSVFFTVDCKRISIIRLMPR